jgi:hypothetical protein
MSQSPYSLSVVFIRPDDGLHFFFEKVDLLSQPTNFCLKLGYLWLDFLTVFSEFRVVVCWIVSAEPVCLILQTFVTAVWRYLPLLEAVIFIFMGTWFESGDSCVFLR